MMLLRNVYRECKIEEFGEQGFCSLTLLVTHVTCLRDGGLMSEEGGPGSGDGLEGSGCKELVVQLRPGQHALDLEIARAACTTYRCLAPKIRYLDLKLPGGLHAYEMQRLRGTPLSRLRPRCRTLDSDASKKLQRLIADFASIIAQSWSTSSKEATLSRNARADSPMNDATDMLPSCTGRVGSSIINRLRKLASELPDWPLRNRAQATLKAVCGMVGYPVVLNHGDLIPSNILVDEDTWRITGLVDWAEAEMLPFGTCLYGLEYLLGFMDNPLSDGCLQPGGHAVFRYFDIAAELRELFWMRLLDAVPELDGRLRDVKVMRDLGVLLWRGFAWDEGAIDRVVNEVDDAEELVYLRTFLNTS